MAVTTDPTTTPVPELSQPHNQPADDLCHYVCCAIDRTFCGQGTEGQADCIDGSCGQPDCVVCDDLHHANINGCPFGHNCDDHLAKIGEQQEKLRREQCP